MSKGKYCNGHTNEFPKYYTLKAFLIYIYPFWGLSVWSNVDFLIALTGRWICKKFWRRAELCVLPARCVTVFCCTPTHLTIISAVMLFVLLRLFRNHFARCISNTPSTHLLAGDRLSLKIFCKYNSFRPYNNKEYVPNTNCKFSFCFNTLPEIIITLQIIIRNIQRAQT